MLAHVQINGFEYTEDTSLTILQVAKKHGVNIPTLCYLVKPESNFEHRPASCRVCIVEVVGRRNLVPACSTYITDGMVIYTNSIRVRSERKAVVELLLSNHPNDCLTCEKCGNCELQNVATELGIKRNNFVGPLSQANEEKIMGSIRRNPSKCILCHRCTELCEKVQSVNAITASQRGFKTIISESYDCVNCGQCVQVCPTGALLQVDNTREIDAIIHNTDKYVVVHTAPSVRVALGEEFGLEPGTDVTGKMITALRMIGFKKVFDTNFSADLTIMEEAKELVSRLQNGGKLPMITSCCPGWINFIETQYPELLSLPSSCKSPQEMLSSIIKTYYAKKEGLDPHNIVVVSLMPCIAKKDELQREALKVDGMQATDYSMSTKEFAAMLKRFGIDLKSLPDGQFDSPLGMSSGAADIFGKSAGVMEAAIRTAYMWMNNDYLNDIEFHGLFGIPNAREAHVMMDEDTVLDICVVAGLASARQILERVKNGEAHYHFIEVMACPGGCINGGGQPIDYRKDHGEVISGRRKGLINIDKNKSLRVSCENEDIQKLYKEFLIEPNSQVAHHILHTSYSNRKN